MEAQQDVQKDMAAIAASVSNGKTDGEDMARYNRGIELFARDSETHFYEWDSETTSYSISSSLSKL